MTDEQRSQTGWIGTQEWVVTLCPGPYFYQARPKPSFLLVDFLARSRERAQPLETMSEKSVLVSEEDRRSKGVNPTEVAVGSPASVVKVEDLVFGYGEGDFILRIPELRLAPGSTNAFIGPSGSGKTTLLHLLAGVRLPHSGRIETLGVAIPVLSDSARRRFRIQNVGLVFQEFELVEYLSVLDNILLAYRIHPALQLTPEVRERATAAAAQVGIGDKLGRYPNHLSQGERQRVAVCRALLTRPAILMADEPTGNLDPDNKDRVLDILFDYVEANRASLLTVTHDHDLLDRFQRVIDFKDLVS